MIDTGIFNMKVSYKDILQNSKAYREKEYISYFFKHIADIKYDEPVFESTSLPPYDCFYSSIVKDTTERLTKTRHLMQRNSRNCFFCFVDKETWNNAFGSNIPPIRRKDIVDKADIDVYWQKSVSRSDVNSHGALDEWIATRIFKSLKRQHIAWFVHSYVYIILVFCDSRTQITKNDFAIYYWNTSAEFKKYPNKTEIFGATRHVRFVKNVGDELVLIEAKDKELVDCVNAFTKGERDFELYEQTKEHYEDICFEIENNIEYITIEGPARSGKTILSMLLLNKFPNAKLLLMNYKFYNDLKTAFKTLGKEFPENRIYHHDFSKNSGCWLKSKQDKTFVDDFSFLIVDEAQRLGRMDAYYSFYTGRSYSAFNPFESIKNITDHKCTIFFGDNLQRINANKDEGFDIIKKYYSDKPFRQHMFYETIGIPRQILTNILYMLGFDGMRPINPGEYQIINYDTDDKLIEAFNNDLSKRKHYVSLAFSNEDNFSFGTKEKINKIPKSYSDHFNYLFNDEIANKYYLTPYEIISREAESVYLYIPDLMDEMSYKDTKKHSYVYMQLYTLMTRATASLNIYSRNGNVRKVIERKIKEITASEETINPNEQYDYDVFIAYHGTCDENGTYPAAKKLCDMLTENGIKVFLNNYQCNENDRDLGFNSTTRIVQKSKSLVLVVNDSAPIDGNGMLLQKNDDGTLNQLNQELKTFNDLINTARRTHKSGFKCLYRGTLTSMDNIYKYLNSFYQELSYGFDCCCLEFEDILKWVLDNKE